MPKFTLIGATNYLGVLPRPFVDRFMIQPCFKPYTEAEIIQIAHHSAQTVQEMFQIQNIDELGLTKLDRRVLEYLAAVIRSIGIGTLSQTVDEKQSTIENLVEPWLVRLHLMVKTSQGRQITELGLQHLGQELPESRFIKA